MIIGTGIDIVSIPRFSKVWKRWGSRFLERIFTEQEIEYCLSKPYPEEHLAARFAAKESVLKALSQAKTNYAIVWRCIEIIKESSGKPNIRLKDKRDLLGFRMGKDIIHLSISHCKEYAVAGAVLESKQ
jgi:holo-[acyl-carrier protein] synthase